jgi:hypothetical protein
MMRIPRVPPVPPLPHHRRTLLRLARWTTIAAIGALSIAAVAARSTPPVEERPVVRGPIGRGPIGPIQTFSIAGVPNDPQPTCTVTAGQFAGWFQSGAPSLNGVVNPANSILFPNNSNCAFYQWSEQMFLWVTSPAPALYGGGGGRIFNSPAFYDVTPLDSTGHRTLIGHAGGLLSNLSLRSAQPGPHGLQLIFDKAGTAFEVEPPKQGPNGKQLILNEKGEEVEIEKSRLEGGKPVFLDKAGNTITRPRPVLAAAPREELALPQKDRLALQENARLAAPPAGAAAAAHLPATPRAQKFVVNGTPVFLNSSGAVIDTEEGQAQDNAVLMAQNGSLVYYITMYNDVNAYFVTALADHALSATQFPTTQAALNPIVSFAAAHGKTFPDPNALTVELKTSWVETAGLANPGSYITMTATIPTYTKSSSSWVASGQKTATLALVGLHFVATAAGHPEMIWATFEHVGNSPDATYAYNSTSGAKTVTQSTAGTWLFAANGATAPFNVAHMTLSGANINVVSSGPSNTLRMKPWGASSDKLPNPLVGSIAASNTEIISIDNSVLSQLAAGDLRANYVMRGAAWTESGNNPDQPFPNGIEVGTSQLANTTMETYQQGSGAFSASVNCFFCHGTNTTVVSHVFGDIKPLF